MTYKSNLIFLGLIFFSTGILAQNVRHAEVSSASVEKSRRDQENLERTADLSPASRALHESLSRPISDSDRAKLVQDAVIIGDRSVIPYLKARLEGGYGPPHHLDIALVSLGETQYVDKAIKELESEDYMTKVYAIWKLARFKTKESYRKLYELLDDVTPRDDYPEDDAIIQTLSVVTKRQMASAVENPPSDQDSTAAWKEWFKKNHLID
jgi:HEAT repeat protein